MVFGVHLGQITGVGAALGPFDVARLLANGNTGVALFFSLSGFLLSLPYWRHLTDQAPRPRAGPYFMRRIRRVVPAHFLCLTGLVILNRMWRDEGWLWDVALHYAMVFNFFADTVFSINPPFWTVAVEAQFYLLLPLLFWVVGQRSAGTAAGSLALIAALAYGVHWWLCSQAAQQLAPGERLSPVLLYSLLAHLPHFLLGSLSAWLYCTFQLSPAQRWDAVRPGRETTWWVVAVLLAAILATPLDDLLQIPYGRYNLPLVPLLLCGLLLLTPLTVSGQMLLDNRPARWLGAISYGIYIYHLPILNWIARGMKRLAISPQEHWFVYGLAGLAATLAVASLSYRLVELPLLRNAQAPHART